LINKDKLEQESRKLLDKAAEIKNYKIEIDKTKVNNEYELESKKKSISETELQIIEAERSLKNLLNDSSNQVLVHAQNDLKQSRISLENEQKKLETYEIKAPFDGVITKIDYQV
jgi:HlyD family secretion protein